MREPKKTKYYSGPDSVFYCAKFDEIFILEDTGGQTINIKTGVILGRVYSHRDKLGLLKRISVTGIDGNKNIIRLGDL